MSDFVTILTSSNSILLTKKFTPDDAGKVNKTAIANELTFTCEERPVNNLDDIERILRGLLDQPHKAIIRGKRKAGVEFPNFRRCIGPESTYESCSHRWVCLDFDDIHYNGSHISCDPLAAIKYLKLWLPPLFQRECVYRFSSSQNVPSCINGHIEKKIRAHLYFWLDEAVTDEELKFYFRFHDCPVDMHLFNPVQLHYTARPIFDGLDDPFQERIGRCQ